MWSIKCTQALAALILMVSAANVLSCAFAVDETDVRSAILAAEERIAVCYRAVADAEKAGANTTALLAVLNEAGELLSRANLACKENLTRARLFALLSQEKLSGVAAQADDLKEDAMQERYWDFMVNVVGSIVGAIVVICGGFVLWSFLKGKYGKAGRSRLMSVQEFHAPFIVITGILVLLVASPALSRLLVLPRTEFFTELWILGPDHTAENYPFNISRNQNYNVFLGIGNQLGHCGYYLVEVKFRNQTQSAPDSFNLTPSSLPPLFNITAFVADEGSWELPLTFSFDYEYDETAQMVQLDNLTSNDAVVNMSGYTVAWNSTTDRFSGDLLFELWIYNGTASGFQYHERFLRLNLNLTIS